jgi:error-prone DNA polymerase
MQYVELHARSAFSFLEGASLPENLARECAERGMSAMALLDRDGVYGSPRFHMAAKQFRIKAHIGAEISLPDGSNCPVLVRSRTGYQNLSRLITTAKLRTPKKQVATCQLEELWEHSDGLICLTGDENGPLARALKSGGVDAARETLHRLVCMFGRENLYIELQRHADRFQESRNAVAVELAREFHWRRTESAMPPQRSATLPMFLPASRTNADSIRRDSFSHETVNAIFAHQRKWRTFFLTFPKLLPTL